jgi:hypothetical protein
MRIKSIFLVAALLMLCTAAAYADVRISSVITAEAIQTGNAELVGDVELWVKEQAAVADVITITYGGLPITKAPAIDAASTWLCTIANTDYVNGIITLNCPASALDTFVRIKGVRLQINGYAGNTVYAELGTLNNTIWAGMDTTKIVKKIGPGLLAATTGTTAVYMANKNALVEPGYWTLTEGFASAWKTMDQAGLGATQGVEIKLRCVGVPTDTMLNVDVYGATLPNGTNDIGFLAADYFTSTTTEIILTFSNTDQSALEDVTLSFSLSSSLTLLPIQNYKVYATLSPVQAGLKSGAPYTPSPKYPKFAEQLLPADGFTAVIIVPNSTNMIIPYITTELGYNTGIAIANTTMDPWDTDKGGALEQDGAVTVTFYANDGSAPIVYSSVTDGAKGKGLTTVGGLLKSGSTWTVLATELLAAKGRTTPFAGYAIIVVDSTNAHGAAYSTNFSGFTASTPVIVIDVPAMYSRTPDYGTEWTTF